MKEELVKLDVTELYNLYLKVLDVKKNVKSNIVEIDPKDLKPKRSKRGSKNK